jgi:hypothetical protein
MKNLKERYKRTVERKLQEGEDIIFDEEKGIINDETGEVVIDIRIIRGDFENLGLSKDDDENEKNNIGSAESNTDDKKKQSIPEEEIIDTFKGQNNSERSEDGFNDDESVEEDIEINK